MHIEHEMAMKDHRWIVDGGEGSMSAAYFSQINLSNIDIQHWNAECMMENRIG